MAVTPPISSFFGLDPLFLSAPAASSSLINPLLYGSSYQMVPINHGGFYSGIPPIFGGQGFTGFSTVPFDILGSTGSIDSGFSAGGAFGNGYGTYPFGSSGSQQPMPQPIPVCIPIPVIPVCPPPMPVCPQPAQGTYFSGFGTFGFSGGSFSGYPVNQFAYAA